MYNINIMEKELKKQRYRDYIVPLNQFSATPKPSEPTKPVEVKAEIDSKIEEKANSLVKITKDMEVPKDELKEFIKNVYKIKHNSKVEKIKLFLGYVQKLVIGVLSILIMSETLLYLLGVIDKETHDKIFSTDSKMLTYCSAILGAFVFVYLMIYYFIPMIRLWSVLRFCRKYQKEVLEILEKHNYYYDTKEHIIKLK